MRRGVSNGLCEKSGPENAGLFLRILAVELLKKKKKNCTWNDGLEKSIFLFGVGEKWVGLGDCESTMAREDKVKTTIWEKSDIF